MFWRKRFKMALLPSPLQEDKLGALVRGGRWRTRHDDQTQLLAVIQATPAAPRHIRPQAARPALLKQPPGLSGRARLAGIEPVRPP